MAKVRNLATTEIEAYGYTFSPLSEGVIDDTAVEAFEALDGFEVVKEEKKKKAKK